MPALRLPALLFLATTLAAPAAFAQSGDLDPGFGIGGVATVAVPTDIYDLAEQQQGQNFGKIVVVGSMPSLDGWSIARLDADGSLDTTFGTNGTVSLFPDDPNHATDVVLDASDRILVTGWVAYPGDGGYFTVVRLLPDGVLDSSFGNGGIADVQIGNGSFSNCIALQDDGKIVLGGYAAGKKSHAFALARFRDDGTLDTDSFGPTGKKRITYEGYVLHDIASRQHDEPVSGAIALQDDGKIVLGGYTGYPTMNDSWTLARYNTDGTVDKGFGDDGVVIQSFPLFDYVQLWSLALAADGSRIYVSGRVQPTLNDDYDAAVAAYDLNGDLVAGFGTSGLTITGYPLEDNGIGCVVQPADGKIVVCGNADIGGTYEATAFRFDLNGDLDPTFGTAGLAGFTATGFALARSIILDGSRLLLGGGSGGGGIVVRYQ